MDNPQAQIQKALKLAKAAGLDPVSLEALEETLTIQSLERSGAGQLAIDIAQLSRDSRERIATLANFANNQMADIAQRGASGVMALSDSEWDALLEEED